MNQNASNLPRLFIGSSEEATEVARAINENLKNDAEITPWPDAFPLGQSFLDSLLEQVKKSDFAVLVMNPDDITKSRGRESWSPRDNVVFELGLFTGRIGAERCYCIHPEEIDLKLPSDLLGVKTAHYQANHSAGLTAAVSAACNEIRRRIKKLGFRAQVSDAEKFCARLVGFWWEYIKPAKRSALGFLEMESDYSGGLRIIAEAHGEDGSRAADWRTDGCVINPRERKIRYLWTGHYLDTPNKSFEGFGDFFFNDADDLFLRGHGYFAELDVANLEKTKKRTGTVARCSQTEVGIMRSGNSVQINALIRKKLAESSPAGSQNER